MGTIPENIGKRHRRDTKSVDEQGFQLALDEVECQQGAGQGLQVRYRR